MDSAIPERPAALLSLEEAAALLGLPPANLLLWDRHYGDELNLPRDPSGQPRFSGEHLQKLREIDRLVRLEHHPPAEVRRRLRRARPAPVMRNPAPTLPTAEHSPAYPAGWSAALDHLREEIAYLLEENRALQELVGRLIAYIEEMGQNLRPAASPSSPASPAPPPSPENKKGPRTVRAWVPKALED